MNNVRAADAFDLSEMLPHAPTCGAILHEECGLLDFGTVELQAHEVGQARQHALRHPYILRFERRNRVQRIEEEVRLELHLRHPIHLSGDRETQSSRPSL